jgi:hypothetical protein
VKSLAPSSLSINFYVGRLTITAAQRRTELFLTGQMLEARSGIRLSPRRAGFLV